MTACLQEGQGTYVISGDKEDPGWERSRDGEIISGVTFNVGVDRFYIVQPDAFSTAGDCELRPNWNMALCTNTKKYGNVRITCIVSSYIAMRSICMIALYYKMHLC